jgi:hypothetical protein
MSEPESKHFEIIGDEHAVPHKIEELQGEKDASVLKQKFIIIKRSAENYQMHIFWLALYTMVLLSIFAERAYCETAKNVHNSFLQHNLFLFRLFRGKRACWSATNCRLRSDSDKRRRLRDDVHLLNPFGHYVQKHDYLYEGNVVAPRYSI